MRQIHLGILLSVLALGATAQAGYTTSVQIDGGDAIWLAGRTDVVVPPAASGWSFLTRHTNPTPEEIQEKRIAQINQTIQQLRSRYLKHPDKKLRDSGRYFIRLLGRRLADHEKSIDPARV